MEIEGFGISKPTGRYVETGVWRCPSTQWPVNYEKDYWRFSYGYNNFGILPIGNLTNAFGLLGNYSINSNSLAVVSPITESEVVAPCDMMAIGESDGLIFMRSEGYDFDFPKKPLRHGNKANVVFCDGHVESPPLPFLFADTSDAALSRWNRDHQPHRERLAQ